MAISEIRSRLNPLLLVPIVCVLALHAGCGREDDDEPKLARRAAEMADLPQAVRDAAQKALPDVKFTDVWRNVDADGNLHSYEIRGKAPAGKIREARVDPNGKILEME